jgi:plasmid stability protein
MAEVLIRDLDDKVIERLNIQAAARGLSLEDELREILTAAAKSSFERPNREELLKELERIRAMTPPHPPGTTFPLAEDLIREDRDSR